MRYTPGVTKQVTKQAKLNHDKFMNNSMIQVISTIAASALIAGLGGIEVTGDVLTGATVGLSYLAVAVLVAIAASDYRGSQRDYTA